MSPWIDPRPAPDPTAPRPTRRLASDPDEIQDLLRLCRNGQVYEVERWLDTDRPIQVDEAALHGRQRKRLSPLHIAVESGQQSLVVLLLANGFRWDLERTSPFEVALSQRQCHLLDALFTWGVDPTKTYPYEILKTYQTAIIERFWRAGNNLSAGGELSAILASDTSNRPLYGFVKNHRQEDPRLQRSVDRALCLAVRAENEKAVSMCLWAGGNPRAPIPDLDARPTGSDDKDAAEADDDDSSWRRSALELAVFENKPKMLAFLRPDPEVDDMAKLYSLVFHPEVLPVLLAIQPPEDWSAIIDRQLTRFTWQVDPRFSKGWNYTAFSDLEKTLVWGGRLERISDHLLRSLRKAIKQLDANDARKFARLVRRCASDAVFRQIFGHPSLALRFAEFGLSRETIRGIARSGDVPKEVTQAAKLLLGTTARRSWRPRDPQREVRIARDELYEQVWRQPLRTVAGEYGLSDNGLRKICARLDVPCPARGYWARKKNGHEVRQQLLPKAVPGQETEVWIARRDGATVDEPIAPPQG
jgi:ribosomal protein S14